MHAALASHPMGAKDGPRRVERDAQLLGVAANLCE